MNDRMSGGVGAGLLPCPFCGGEGRLSKPTCRPDTPYNPADRLFPIVRCQDCNAEAWGSDENYDGSTARAAWNRRVSLTAATPFIRDASVGGET
jgi:hypothetical protein